MAKSTEIVGTGITARPVTRYSDDDIPPAFDAFARQWNEAVAKAGSPFGATVLNVEQACRRILADAGNGRFVADSSEDYARRTLRAIDSTKASIACGDADMAARMAVDVGRLITEADIKGRWEGHALRGEKNRATLLSAGQRANNLRQDEAKSRREGWQAMADRIWATNQHLRKADVGKRIAGKIGGNPDTIRRKIKRK